MVARRYFDDEPDLSPFLTALHDVRKKATREFQLQTLPARKHALALSAAATDSRHWSEHPDGCWLPRTRPDSNKQTIHLGHI
jgi:hypothetical protein